MSKENEKVIAYKGFNFDLTCKDMQYEEGKTYTMPEDEIKLCYRGFHACLKPGYVFNYYHDFDSVYYKVELNKDAIIQTDDADSKVCSNEIKLLEKIGGPLDMLKYCIQQNTYTKNYKWIAPILDIEDKFIGIIKNKKDFEKYKEKGIKVGHKFVILDGEINTIWRCVERTNNKNNTIYYFQTETAIDFTCIDDNLDDNVCYGSFTETQLYRKLSNGLGKRLSNKLGDHLSKNNLREGSIITLPSVKEVCKNSIENNFTWYKYLNFANLYRPAFRLRSISSWDCFGSADIFGNVTYKHASIYSTVYPVIILV